MHTRPAAALLAGSLGALTLLCASASASPARATLHSRTLTIHLTARQSASAPQEGPIERIALDGTHAAFVAGVPVSRSDQLGQRLYRWNLATGRKTAVSGAKTGAIPETSTGIGISDIALTGSSSAWIVRSGGNEESDDALLGSMPRAGHDRQLATSERYVIGDGDLYHGDWIGGLVSGGSQVWYSTWTTDASGNVTESALWRRSGSTTRQLASGSGAVVAASADGGRVALLRTDGSVAIYGSDGTLQTTIGGAGSADPACVTICPAEGVALTGKLVAVLASAKPCCGADSIEVYDRTTGALLHTWPNVSGYVWQFDAHDGIAIYGQGDRLFAIDLETGKTAVVAHRTRTIEQARLDKAGLLYYFNGRWSSKRGWSGTLVFVPFRTIAAKVAG
ncbi:MAG TPA: hypothetical protein VLW49_08450 [Gaiellaceae bacterium]|nr:hypothetical protein [Gaiellaceae bacterium]